MLDVSDLPEIAEVQFLEEDTQAFSDWLKPFQLLNGEKVVLCDTTTPFPRPFLPEPL
ncbi:hypothetical protein SK128_024370, partial [Halocaridina rubra]